MVLSTLIRDVQATKDQIGPSDSETLVFKKFDEAIVTLPASYKIDGENINNAFIVGHAANGIVGTATGVGGGQVVIGNQALGSTTTHRILNDGDIFCDMLRTSDFINTSNTDCTVDTTNFKLTFGGVSTERFESSSVALGNGNINNATLILADAMLSSAADFSIELTSDGGSNWEAATRNSLHTFTNVGTDLRYAIIANTGAALYVRSTSDSTDTPIFVRYNE